MSGFIVEATCQFDVWQKNKWMGTTLDTCGLSYSPGLKGFWSRVSSRCSSCCSSSCPWPWGQVPMCQAPLELLGQITSSSQVNSYQVLSFYRVFFSLKISISSEGKALPVVPRRHLSSRRSSPRFPRLPQVQGWHRWMWWMSQLAWHGGNLCFGYFCSFLMF